MPADGKTKDTKDGRRNKLSLKKKTLKDGAKAASTSSSSSKGIQVLPGPADLNETCEFRETASFKAGGQLKLPRGKANNAPQRKDSCSKTTDIKQKDGEASRPANESEPVAPATVDHSAVSVTTVDDGAVAMATVKEEGVQCQVCNKTLTHMSSRHRQQHVNRCMDRVLAQEQSDREQRGLLERARTAVLDCPMCGKPFKTDTGRLSHLKKCSVDMGVATEMLLKLTKDQEAERQSALARGVLPHSLTHLKIKSAAPSRKRKVKEPKSQYDEDVQVAMAISSSLAEQEKRQGEELLGKTAPPPDSRGPAAKRGKKKTGFETVCLLTTLSDGDKQRRLGEKVNNILVQEGCSSEFNDKVELRDSYIRTLDCAGCGLWESSVQEPGGGAGSLATFYVDTLVPPLTVRKTVPGGGEKARRRKIPGREVTFIEENTEPDSKREKLPSEGDDVITASTQTAAVLAELATDDTSFHASLTASQDNPADHSLLNDTQCSGYCVQTLTLKAEAQQEEHSRALLDYRSLVNNPGCSDLRVSTADGQTLHAHTLILSVRCPNLIKMAKGAVVKLDASMDTVLSLLTYLYTGELTLTGTSKTELQELASQLELPNLETLCKNLNPSTENSGNVSERDTNVFDPKEQFTESKLDLKQIWGESDSDSDVEEEGKNVEQGSDVREEVNSELEDEDYHAIMCTQRRLVRASSKEEEKEKEDNDEHKEEISPCKGDISSDSRDMVIGDIEDDDNVSLNEAKEDVGMKQVSLSSSISDIGLSLCESPMSDKAENKVSENKRAFDDGDRNTVSKSTDEFEDSIVLTSDDEVVPSPKRARLSSGRDMDVDNGEDNTDESRVEVKEIQNSSRTSSRYSGNKSDAHGRRTSDENVSVNSFNQSGADLFSSPTPVKRNLALGSESVRSTEKGATEKLVNRNLHDISQSPGDTVDSSIVLEDSGSDKSDVEMETETVSTETVSKLSKKSGKHKTVGKNELEYKTTTEEYTESITETTKVTRSKTTKTKFTEIKSTGAKSPDTKSRAAACVGETSVDVHTPSKAPGDEEDNIHNARVSEDDEELEITGDNFEELHKGSPVFKDKKSNKAKLNSTDNFGSTPNTGHSAAVLDQCFDDSFHDSDLTEISFINDENMADTEGSEDTTETHNNKQPTDKQQHINDKLTDKQHSDIDALPEEIVEIASEDTCSSLGQNESINLTLSQGSAVSKCSFLGVRIGERASQARREEHDDDDDAGRDHEDGSSELGVEPDGETGEAVDDADRVDHIPGSSEADVWEDFDDDGMAFIPPVESPGVVSPTAGNEAAVDMENSSLQDGEDSFVFHVDSPIEGPSHKPPAAVCGAKASFVTPTVSASGKNKKPRPWEPPSPFTPMPKYDKMATPLIKQAVQQYGVKPVGKKRMIKVLQDIYQQTHSYETDSECEELGDTEGPASSALVTAGMSQAQGDTGADSEEDGELDLSQESHASQDSDIGDPCEVFEESCLHMVSSDSDASPQKSADVTRQIMNYMKKNPDLHRRILMYEPLELDVLKADLKEAKVKCSMDKLMDFLDERCIAFTTKNSRNSRRGRQKKGSPKKKATANSPKKRGRPKSTKSVTSSQS